MIGKFFFYGAFSKTHNSQLMGMIFNTREGVVLPF